MWISLFRLPSFRRFPLRRALGVASLLGLLLAVTAAAACGDDESAATTSPAVTSGPTTTSGMPTSSTTSGPGGMGGSGGAAPATCADYCADSIATCTGANVQYLDQGQCVAFCSEFVQGVVGETTNDTLECRAYHVGAAMGATANQDMHCHHSGPYGGGPCSASSNVCDTFCAYAMSICGTMAFASLTECTSECAPLVGANYQFAASQMGNTLDCRGYHLEAAAGAAANQTMHCPHVGGAVPCQ